MKYNNIMKGVAACTMGALLMTTSCTNLDEELYGQLSPDTYYQNESEALSSVVGVYSLMCRMFQAGGDGWRIGEYSTDELYCPGRGGGWFDEGVNEIMRHECTATNARLQTCWNTNVFAIIGGANAVLESLESSPKADNYKNLIAEVRTLRAMGYFFALEYWGNVPLSTDGRTDANNLPKTTEAKDIYAFVEKELTEAAADLPSVTTVTSSYYPRFTKEAALCRLAQLYMMGEFYTGSARWADAQKVCQQIIDTKHYSLEEKVSDCFRCDHEGTSLEVISALSVDPSKSVDGNEFWLYSQGEWDMAKYSCTAYGARGYCFSDEALDRYEAGDERLEMLEYGPQYDLSGNMLDASGNIVTDASKQLVIKGLHNINDSQTNEGYIVLKYTPLGGTWQGNSLANDYIVDRYSNVLLMKCEALFRQSGNPKDKDALDLINEVRNRSGLNDLDVLSLAAIEKERANEFIWEGQRRRDMLRFGSFFTFTDWYKTSADKDHNTQFFPIPQQQLAANPKLDQNPGY